jgi:nucleotide-binding universal stress UspA family protein
VTLEGVFYRIVVPTDFSTCAEEAWALAQRVAHTCGSELVLVHVLEAPLDSEARETLEQWAAKARQRGLKARTVVRTGTPHQEIVALATDERADLVVIGTHGRGGLNRALLGSVADRVVRLAPCPVLTVREPA